MEAQPPPSIDISKGQKLVVTVEDAFPDLLLLSYEHGTQVFQGVLLDSSKGRLPCGIYPPGGVFPPPPPPETTSPSENDDKLFSVKQRHTYYQQDPNVPVVDPNAKAKKGVQLRQSISLTQRFKNSRMTVRLRPRQVLCSKCQSICNEKSENVSGAKGQKPSEVPTAAKQNTETRSSSRSYRDKSNQDSKCNSQSRRTERSPQKNVRLVPKLVKLKPSEIEAATSKGVSCLKKNASRNTRSEPEVSDNDEYVGNNALYSVSGNNEGSEGRVPKLKLISGAGDTRRKGRIPKMTISTLNLGLMGTENPKEATESDFSDQKPQSIPKMILSTSGILSEPLSDKKEKESGKGRKSDSGEGGLDAKELKLRSGNIHKLTISAKGDQEFNENLAERISPIQKLTILPLIPKKESQGDDTNESKHHKMAKGYSEDSHSEKMSLRKKRSLGSMEDLWDESVFDETSKKHKREEEQEDSVEESEKLAEDSLDGDKPKATPILKISFGPEGKGTVLKIPSKSTVVPVSNSEIDTEEEITKKCKDMSAKAAKKALKKAKKEAQKKIGGASPAYMVGGMSPRFGGMSPLRLGGMSPARLGSFSPARFGGTSPARFGGMSPARAAAVDLSTRDLPPKKHKHKVKHKKKHKDERRHKLTDENKVQTDQKDDTKDNSLPTSDSADADKADIPVENITPDVQWNSERHDYSDQSATQPNTQSTGTGTMNPQSAVTPLQSRHKLSISIKRVSNASYVACDSSHSDGERTVTPTNANCSEDLLPDPTKYSTGEKSEEFDKCIAAEATNSYHMESTNMEALRYLGDDRRDGTTLGAGGPYGMETPEPSLAGSNSPYSDDPGSIPDFPSGSIDGGEEQPSGELLMRLSWQEVRQCRLSDGRTMAVGDVVWGKIHGFPWWPAKVVGMRVLREGGGEAKWQQAHVSWYGSSTSSIMPAATLQPFLKMFKMRHNKKKRGPYREAIKQATLEAEQTLGGEEVTYSDRAVGVEGAATDGSTTVRKEATATLRPQDIVASGQVAKEYNSQLEWESREGSGSGEWVAQEKLVGETGCWGQGVGELPLQPVKQSLGVSVQQNFGVQSLAQQDVSLLAQLNLGLPVQPNLGLPLQSSLGISALPLQPGTTLPAQPSVELPVQPGIGLRVQQGLPVQPGFDLPVQQELLLQQGIGFPVQQSIGLPMQQGIGLPLHQSIGIPVQQGNGLPLQQGIGLPVQQGIGLPVQQGVEIRGEGTGKGLVECPIEGEAGRVVDGEQQHPAAEHLLGASPREVDVVS